MDELVMVGDGWCVCYGLVMVDCVLWLGDGRWYGVYSGLMMVCVLWVDDGR